MAEELKEVLKHESDVLLQKPDAEDFPSQL